MSVFKAKDYDELLAGWPTGQPNTDLVGLEDYMAGRRHGAQKVHTLPASLARDTDVYISRPVVPNRALAEVLGSITAFDNPNKGTTCHKAGTDIKLGLHATMLSTRGVEDVQIPDENDFDPALRVPSLALGVGKLMLDSIKLLGGDANHHVGLVFDHKSRWKLEEERQKLLGCFFSGLYLDRSKAGRDFMPHVTLATTKHEAVAEQIMKVLQQHKGLPLQVGLAPARYSVEKNRYAEMTA